MKTFFHKIVLTVAMLLAGVRSVAALEGVVVIVNQGVPGDNISAAALKEIYTGRTTYWSNGQGIDLGVLADKVDSKADAALQSVSGMDNSHFKTFWQRMVFSGRGQQPNKADDVAALVAFVAATKGAIALVPADTVLKDVKLLEVK